jgi:Secretion system C-terminal sorting domain
MKNKLVKITKRLSLFVIFFIDVKGFAQYNLINNSSFEDYIVCPTNFNSPPPKKWYLPTNFFPNYSNSCSNPSTWGVPYNTGNDNFQYARTGNAYIGYTAINFPPKNIRDYYQTKLKDSLRQSKNYYVEFFIVFQNGKKLKCNNISALLSKSAVRVDTVATPYGVLNANPQITNYGNPIITDTLNWVKVSGIFKAEGGEQYLTLGNFKDDAHTNYFASQPTGYNGAAIMIDDVSVIPLDSMPLQADAGRDTTITIGDSVFIGSYTNGIDTIKWQVQNTGNIIDSTKPGFWVHPLTNTCYMLTQTVNGYTSSDTVCVTVKPLPLKFISYTVSIPLLGGGRGGLVQNSWATASEINVSHFNILRSENGKDFKIIGNTNAKGFSYNQYSFIDETPSEGLNYYKIMSVDKDGRTQYSEVKNVSLNKKNGISIFPNPCKDYVNISCIGMKEINVLNQFGQVVKQLKVSSEKLIVDTKALPKGLYLLQIITTKNYVYNEKFIVQ